MSESTKTFNDLLDCQNGYNELLEKYLLLQKSIGSGEDECLQDNSIEYNKPLHIGAVFIILGCSIIGTIIPILATNIKCLKIPKYVIIVGKCIGIGVILTCSLIHMLLPAVESLQSPCLPSSFTESYEAYAYLFALLAIIAMQFLDFSFLQYIIYKHQLKLKNNNDSPSPTSSNKEEESIIESYQSTPGYDAEDNKQKSSISKDGHNYNHSHDHNHDHSSGGGGGHIHGGLLIDPHSIKTIEAYLLEFGITIHSVFIGIAVGVVDDSTLRALLVALSFHQFFEGVALGSRISDAKLNSHWHEALLASIFSISAPIGIAIGVGVASSINVNGETFLFVQGIFDSVCAGILLYIGFALLFKDFPEDMNELCKGKKYSSLLKMGMFIGIWVGVALMSLIGKYL